MSHARVRPRRAELARFVVGVVASALLVAGGTLFTLATAPAGLPGRQATVVGSGSMAPTLEVGDVVVVQDWPAEKGMIGPPSIVLVDRPGRTPLLHRVVEDDGHTYVTKGDANEDVDSDRVDPRRVLGVGRLVVPQVGRVTLWLQDRNPLALVGFGAAVALLTWLARFGWLDAYDPWKLAARRATADGSGETDGGDDADSTATGPPTIAADDGPGAAPVASIRRGFVATGIGRVTRRAWALAVAVLVGLGTVSASTSAFSAATSAGGTFTAETVSPVGNLAATCTIAPTIVGVTSAGPATNTPLTLAGLRGGDTLLLSRTGVRGVAGGRYADPGTPSGYTQLVLATGGLGRFHAIYQRSASAATETVAHSPSQADVLIAVRGGVYQDSSAAGSVFERGGTVTAPALKAPGQGLLLTFWAVERGGVHFSVPKGMSEVADAARFSSDISMSVHKQTVAPGDTAPRTTTMTASGSPGRVDARNSGASLFVRSTRYASLTWPASATTKVDGYTIRRNGTEVATVPGRDTTTWLDPTTLGNGDTTYTVFARARGWTSQATPATVSSATCPTG